MSASSTVAGGTPPSASAPTPASDTSATADQKALWGSLLADAIAASVPDTEGMQNIFRNLGFFSDPLFLIQLLTLDAFQFDKVQPEHLKSIQQLLHAFIAVCNAQMVVLNDNQQENARRADDAERDVSLLKSVINSTKPLRAKRLTQNPEKFAGDDKNIVTRQEKYITWKTQLKLNFAQDHETFNDHRTQILHICGLLTGEAYTNNRDAIDQIIMDTNSATWDFQSANDLFISLDKQYETLDLSRQASIAFDNCFQKGRPFANFLAEFNTAARQCKKTAEQKVEALKKKVQDEIALKLANLPNPPARDDFEAWAAQCQIFYDNQQEYEHNRKMKASKPQLPFTPRPAAPAQADGDPMQLDTVNRMKDDVRQYCIENKLCFYCKEPGHSVDLCQQKLAADARRGNAFRGRNRGGGRGGLTNRNAFQRNYTAQTSQPLAPAFNNYNQAPPQYPPFPRVRALEQTGFIEGELGSGSGSPAPSDSASNISHQGKE
jgi:hypothetical protein